MGEGIRGGWLDYTIRKREIKKEEKQTCLHRQPKNWGKRQTEEAN